MTGVRGVVMLGSLSVLASMALVLIIFGQRQAEVRLLEQQMQLNRKVSTHSQTLKDRETMHQLLKQVHEKQKKAGDELEAEVNKLAPEVEKKKPQTEACQAEKKVQNEEVERMQKEQTDTEATFKAEKEAWTAEMTKLKEQIVQPSKVCEFARNDSVLVKTLCAAAKAEAQTVVNAETQTVVKVEAQAVAV